MGSPRRFKKKYDTPLHPWRKTRIEEEEKILQEYGLKNKREIWKFRYKLRKILRQAKKLIASSNKQAELEQKQLLNKLIKYNLLTENSNLDDVLGLRLKDLLDRRLQTFVLVKNLANTTEQARQFITHGHISVNGQKITVPSYMVKKYEEDKISYAGRSSLANPENLEVIKIKSKFKEIEIKKEKIKEEKRIEEKKTEEKNPEEKVKKVKEDKKTEKKEKKENKKKEHKK